MVLLFSCQVMSDSLRPMDCSTPGLPVSHQNLPKFMSVELVMPSSHLILSLPLLLPSVFPSIKVFSNKSLFTSGGQSIIYLHICTSNHGLPGGALVKNLPAMRETQVWPVGQEELLEKEMATHSSILMPGESHGWRAGQRVGQKAGQILHQVAELDMTERLTHTHMLMYTYIFDYN